MRKRIIAAALATFTAVTAAQADHHGHMSAAETLKAELSKAGAAEITGRDYKSGTIRHIVLFRYKDDITESERAEIRRRFTALATDSLRDGKPYIVSIESGFQNSGEGADGGFEEAFLVTFRSEGDRNYYVGTPIVSDPAFFDPEHQKFKEFVGPYLAEKDGVLVFDFAVAGERQ